MPNTREKLIELLSRAQDYGTKNTYEERSITIENKDNDQIADYLIANGVTVQEWISVKDEKKPNHGDIALCYMTFGEYRLLQWDDRSKLWVGDYMDFGFDDVAYWQLPQPPKGE